MAGDVTPGGGRASLEAHGWLEAHARLPFRMLVGALGVLLNAAGHRAMGNPVDLGLFWDAGG